MKEWQPQSMKKAMIKGAEKIRRDKTPARTVKVASICAKNEQNIDINIFNNY